ncbi:MAG: AraC family transcriptional regulator [Spirochaetales bacterium]|uniref:AraC family transcriptional regulator n=1 Tax=Candidatus Thalassospirochaeta sargassi TaxID=3119039 RepID=A0AAJ1IGG6_9SPIO|nr:AraC family transcriptional regulator [Spirochaetales bacterium]
MKKRDGFKDQILIVIPPELYVSAKEFTKNLYITDIGYFPQAAEHWVKRPEGCSSCILIICIRGKGIIESNSGRYDIKAGEAVIIPEYYPHNYGSAEGNAWDIFWVHFSGKAAADACRHVYSSEACKPFELKPGNKSRLLFSEICAELSKGLSPTGYELSCGKFWFLISSLSADRKSGIKDGSGIISSCIGIMESRIDGSLSLNELSRMVSVTPQYLCRLFKNKTGHSPIEHYTVLKIQVACRLLDMTTESISSISSRIGIEDPYYFSRVFKKVMGSSPRQYRNRQK